LKKKPVVGTLNRKLGESTIPGPGGAQTPAHRKQGKEMVGVEKQKGKKTISKGGTSRRTWKGFEKGRIGAWGRTVWEGHGKGIKEEKGVGKLKAWRHKPSRYLFG